MWGDKNHCIIEYIGFKMSFMELEEYNDGSSVYMIKWVEDCPKTC